MPKVTVDCIDPNDLNALMESAEEMVGKCNITYYKQAKALQDVGAASSERDAARRIAAETGEPVKTVRQRIYRGKKQMATAVATTGTAIIPTPSPKLEKLEKPVMEVNQAAFDRIVNDTKKEKRPEHGGSRPRSGRKPKKEDTIVRANTNGQFALMAICQLERIQEEDDPDNAIAALVEVAEWIENRINQIKNQGIIE